MTRAEIHNYYKVDAKGIIRSPGKFEGEPDYVVYFWDIGMSGFADHEKGDTWRFDISTEDREEFPNIPSRKRTITLWESEQGFVYHK